MPIKNIKISSGEQNFEGNLKEVVVKPFGTSSHVLMSKRDIGKSLIIIEAEDADYVWILPEIKTEFKQLCSRALDKYSGAKFILYKDCIENVFSGKFKVFHLINLIELLQDSKIKSPLINKIIKTYQIT